MSLGKEEDNSEVKKGDKPKPSEYLIYLSQMPQSATNDDDQDVCIRGID